MPARGGGQWRPGPSSSYRAAVRAATCLTVAVLMGRPVTAGFPISLLRSATADVVSSPEPAFRTSGVPASGIKPLYVHLDPALILSRLPAVGAQRARIDAGQTLVWSLTPSVFTDLTIDSSSGVIPVVLWLRKNENSASPVNRTLTVALSSGATPIGTPVTATLTLVSSLSENVFDIPIASDVTLPAGSTISMSISNVTSGPSNQRVVIEPSSGVGDSRVALPSATVINVDSLEFYDAAFPGGLVVPDATFNDTVYLRAVVSDPFGSFDIRGATLALDDPTGTPAIPPTAMAEVDDTGAAFKTYESSYTFPAGSPLGDWEASVTAVEGTEGTVTHTRIATLPLVLPSFLTVMKSASLAQADPGDEIEYSIVVVNPSTETATQVVVEDVLGEHVALALDTFGAGQPFDLSDGTPSSGLAGATPEFSNDGGATFNYTPVSGGGQAPPGYDGNVTHWRLPMTGTMTGPGANFTLRYRTIVR
jgi:uncharacterized repeat protein (TIGR01451 family)